jgi:Tfp pilus assembly protein PilN
MKNRLSFVLITSRTGIQRRFSIDRRLLLCVMVFLLLLAAGGIAGVLTTAENRELVQSRELLAGKIKHMRAVSQTVAVIEQEERAIREHLGLNDTAPPPDSGRN